jgi:RHS repeat-associated protein
VGRKDSLSDELIQSIDRLNPNQEVDRQTWGLDDIGNWLSTTQTNGNLMQTRTHDVMNRLQQIGGGGSVVVEGTVNEYADITVNSVPANLFEDPLLSPPGYRYRAPVPVVTGANTITVTATDQDQDVATTQWSINVPASQRTFTYDANGNMLTDSAGRVFTWDGKNRLKTVTVSGTTYEWDYDYRDRRVREHVYASGGSKPTIPAKQFIWHDNEIVQERVGTSATAGTISRNHYYGGFTIGATISTAAKYQTFTDHLGHVREVVAASGTNPAIGTVLTRYEYSPYQGPSKVYQFPGTNVEATFQTIGRYYHHEASGLELALYRAYDPELGRWISADPLGERGGLNLYGFVGNSPTFLIDLLGLQPDSEEFWKAYPDYSKSAAEFWRTLGGFMGEIDGKTPSCAARISKALNNSGEAIKNTPGIQTNKNTDGKRYIWSAIELRKYLRKKWGKPDLVISTPEEADELRKKLKPNQIAVGCGRGHAGVIKDGYTADRYMPELDTLVWILPVK